MKEAGALWEGASVRGAASVFYLHLRFVGSLMISPNDYFLLDFYLANPFISFLYFW